MVGSLPDDVRGWRDRAILMIGFCGALRRSEIAALRVEWLEPAKDGLVICLPRSKTDQEGHGARIKIERGHDPATCPVTIVENYRTRAGIHSGPLFRRIWAKGKIGSEPLHDTTITAIVKAHIATYLAHDVSEYGAHSLRAGFATVLDERGVSIGRIKNRGRWTSTEVYKYLRNESEKDNLGQHFVF
jgi:integrase